jgi:hypothetical protein
VSNTDNVNILCKYLMYILSIDWYWQKTGPTSRQKRQTLAGLRWRGPAATGNYRPVLSSERALQNNKQQLSKRKSQGERKIGRRFQLGAWHQDGLADWLSVVMWLWLWLERVFRETWPFRLESLKFETVKYGRESRESRARERLRWLLPSSNSKL